MKVTVFTKKMTDFERQMMEEYLQKKLAKFERLVGEFDDDAVRLEVTAEKFTNKNAYKVEFVMALPKMASKSLVASEDSHDLLKAVDFAEEKLVQQIKRAMEKLHNEHLRAT